MAQKKHLTVAEVIDLFTTPEVNVTIFDYASGDNVYSGSADTLKFKIYEDEFVDSLDPVDREHPYLTINIDSRKHW